VESADAFLVADMELHDAIRQAAGNAILGRFMESIQALGVASRQATGSKRQVRDRSVCDHEAIVAALRARDPAAAADAMHRHIENVELRGRAE
jgi:DNA-binding FadR family transcriptional regulator